MEDKLTSMMNTAEKARVAVKEDEERGFCPEERYQLVFLFAGGLAFGSRYVSRDTANRWHEAAIEHLGRNGERYIPYINQNGLSATLFTQNLIGAQVHKAIELVTFPEFNSPWGLPEDYFAEEEESRPAQPKEARNKVLSFHIRTAGNG
jgi:hypothetical protein